MTEGPFRPRGPVRRPRAGEPGSDEPSDRRASGPRHPSPPTPPRPPAGIASQSTWILGVVIVLALAYITVNTLRTEAPGSRGVQPGTQLPPFAAPIALSDLEGDATVRVKAGEGHPAACDVRGPRVFNVCEATERRPLVLSFFVTRSEDCIDEVDVLQRVARRFPDVGFAAVAIRGDRDDVRDLVRERGWDIPVAYDADGAVSNAYGVAVCPTITFARRGGVTAGTLLGGATEAALARRVEALRDR